MRPRPRGVADMPGTIPVFPLAGALLLPRGQLPLNIFEPRYVAMVDAAMASDRTVGMVQPQGEGGGEVPSLQKVGCAGRIVQFAETGDGRYLVSLVGLARFEIVAEEGSDAPYRSCRVSFDRFAADFVPGAGQDDVDRPAVMTALRRFAEAKRLDLEWSSVEQTPNEALVNALCMMAPFGIREKQALLEAADLKTRAETLVALTEIDLAGGGEGEGRSTLQ